jgi:transposase
MIITLGIDLAKSVFQLHGVDADGRLRLRRQFRRSQMLEFFHRLPPCLIGMEACASTHHRARELAKLGHHVRLKRKARTAYALMRNQTEFRAAQAA